MKTNISNNQLNAIARRPHCLLKAKSLGNLLGLTAPQVGWPSVPLSGLILPFVAGVSVFLLIRKAQP